MGVLYMVQHLEYRGIDEPGSVMALQDIKWEFAVIKSEQANAFVAPGGKVVVFTGLLDMIQGDDSQLAAVLSHEAGHTLARHVVSPSLSLSFSPPDPCLSLLLSSTVSHFFAHEAAHALVRLLSVSGSRRFVWKCLILSLGEGCLTCWGLHVLNDWYCLALSGGFSNSVKADNLACPQGLGLTSWAAHD